MTNHEQGLLINLGIKEGKLADGNWEKLTMVSMATNIDTDYGVGKNPEILLQVFSGQLQVVQDRNRSLGKENEGPNN